MARDLIDGYLHYAHRNRDAKQKVEIEAAKLQTDWNIAQTKLEWEAMKERLRAEQKQTEIDQKERHHSDDLEVRKGHIALLEKQGNADIAVSQGRLELAERQADADAEVARGQLVLGMKQLEANVMLQAERLAFDRERLTAESEQAGAANAASREVATIAAEQALEVARISRAEAVEVAQIGREGAEEVERIRQRGAVAVVEASAAAETAKRRDGDVYNESDSGRRRAEESSRAITGAIGQALVAMVQGAETRKVAAQAEKHRTAERTHEVAITTVKATLQNAGVTHQAFMDIVKRLIERSLGLQTMPNDAEIREWLEEWERERQQ